METAKRLLLPVFTEAKGVEHRWFSGKHPAGNVGVHIHHTEPILRGDKVWTLGVQDVITLGRLFTEKRFNTERVVAVAGAELKAPKYVKTYLGAKVGDLVKDNLANDHVRYISGDVLSGEKKNEEQFLNVYDDQLTVVEEGDYFEMFGWLLPIKARPSVSRTFPNFLFPNLTFKADTNTHGEKRAFVVTGQYEAYLPMDIYLQHLMKNIIINDLERIEGLGIYELVEEDVALCEFTCTSKQPLQQILREGLDMMREQG
jgi:Na+-transporting NADH:ubiquinone oxidoreductase subunit A